MFMQHITSLLQRQYPFALSEDIEDAVMDALEKLLRVHGTHDAYKDDQYRSWIIRVASHSLIDQYRKRLNEICSYNADDVAGTWSADETVIQNECDRLLRHLPHSALTVVQLRAQGFTVEEIGLILQRSSDAVYKTLQRVRSAVCRLLEAHAH